MLKFLIPAIIIFLIVIFWEKIKDFIFEKTNIRINYILTAIALIIFGLILVLLYF